MTEYDDGWFKVSRRLFDSSRWYREDPATLKLLFFLIGEAQNPLNPNPGTVLISDLGLAGRTGLEPATVTSSIDRLCAEDADSRSNPETQGSRRTLERIPGGLRLVNFDLYQPGMVQSMAARAQWRKERARKAAAARWEKHAEARGGVDVSPGVGPELPASSGRPSGRSDPSADLSEASGEPEWAPEDEGDDGGPI